MKNNRRVFIKNTMAGVGILTLPSLLRAENNNPEPRKVVCVGGHPDDPETGCGGTLAKLSNLGHTVTNIYLTTGEAGINGRSHNESAAIRREEVIQACKVLNAKPVFAGQIDGNTIVNNEWIKKVQQLIYAEHPDLVFTHWPVDKHPDHSAASLLATQAWFRAKHKFSLYYFEVLSGRQTMVFHPTDYVDISQTRDQKKKAVYCHASQSPADIYANGHAAMEEFRGREFGVAAAEAFVRMVGKKQGGAF